MKTSIHTPFSTSTNAGQEKVISARHEDGAFKTWQPAFSIGFVLLTYCVVYIWTAPSSIDGSGAERLRAEPGIATETAKTVKNSRLPSKTGGNTSFPSSN